MRKNYWDNDDYDDYNVYGNYNDHRNNSYKNYYSDYDDYFGDGGRRGSDSNRRSGSNRNDNRSRRRYDDYSRSNRGGRYDYNYYGDYDDYGGKEEVGSNVMYLLMTLFFVVISASVVFGKIYTNRSASTDIESEPQYVYSSQSQPSSEPEPVDPAVQKVEDALSAMSLEQKVGQLFMVRDDGKSGLFDIVSQTNAGGAILFADDFKGKDGDEVRAMISEIQSCSDERMFIAVDEEGGTVVRVSSNSKLRSSKFLSPQRLYAKGGFDLIISDTEEKCELLDSLGINMNMAPVADVCTKSSAFMYKRSFGKGAEETAEYVSKVVGTMKATPVASCVKHFPGYGNSQSDTHKGLDVNEKSLDELKSCDLVPFEAAIREGADGIMLTHTIIQSIDPDRPASLSPDVVRLIRDDMGFEGLLISDGLDMGAINEYSGGDSGKVCIMAIKAGVDILCAPNHPVSDFNAVVEAVRSDEISQSRIDESVRRILRVKLGNQ